MYTFEIEQAIGELYKVAKDRKFSAARAKIVLDKKFDKNIINQLVSKGLVERHYHQVVLTKDGLETGYRSLRVINILKKFCQEILALSQKEAEEYIENTYSSITDLVLEEFCALIGHASGDTPPGECCLRAKKDTSEQVLPLSKLPVNTPAKILYIETRNKATLLKLFELGIIPGKTLRLHQLYPTFIVLLDQQQVALTQETAEFIFVRK